MTNKLADLRHLVVGSLKISYLGLVIIAIVFMTSLFFGQESATLALVDGPSSVWFTFALSALICLPLTFFIGGAIKIIVTMIQVNYRAVNERDMRRTISIKKPAIATS